MVAFTIFSYSVSTIKYFYQYIAMCEYILLYY